jgi:hypothetical protein
MHVSLMPEGSPAANWINPRTPKLLFYGFEIHLCIKGYRQFCYA